MDLSWYRICMRISEVSEDDSQIRDPKRWELLCSLPLPLFFPPPGD